MVHFQVSVRLSAELQSAECFRWIGGLFCVLVRYYGNEAMVKEAALKSEEVNSLLCVCVACLRTFEEVS